MAFIRQKMHQWHQLLRNYGRTKLKINFLKTNNAIKDTTWSGRIEICNYYNKKIILDGSHNVDGAKKFNVFKVEKIKPVVLFGMLNNKKIDIFQMLLNIRY